MASGLGLEGQVAAVEARVHEMGIAVCTYTSPNVKEAPFFSDLLSFLFLLGL